LECRLFTRVFGSNEAMMTCLGTVGVGIEALIAVPQVQRLHFLFLVVLFRLTGIL